MAKLPTCYGCRMRQLVIDFSRGLSVIGLARKYQLKKHFVEEAIRLYLKRGKHGKKRTS